MPYDPQQLQTDVEAVMTAPEWQDPATRRDFIRNVGVRSKSALPTDEHSTFMTELWGRMDDRGLVQKSADFVGNAVSEVLKSGPAMAAGAMFAASDAVGLTDTGSGTRLERGVTNLVDQAGQTVKQLAPGESMQAKRDAALEALRAELDTGNVPADFERWAAGEFDSEGEPSADAKRYIDGLREFSKLAVEADTINGSQDREMVRRYLESDRSPTRPFSDIPGQPGPRELLADYLATRDPESWQAFVSQVTETEQQYLSRMQRWTAEQRDGTAATLEQMPEGLNKEMTRRAFDMQGSPIDLATSALPFLRGAKALEVARKGGLAAAGGRLAKGALKEGAQEGVTEKLQDARATNAQVLEAAATGAVGGGLLETGLAVAGAAMRPRADVPAPSLDAMPEDVGDLTAADVADLEPTAAAPTARQPILQGVPDAPRATAPAPIPPPVEPVAPPPAADAEKPGPDSLLAGIRTVEAPLASIRLSKDVPQFKSGANEAGVIEPLQGKYERLGTGPILLWERLDGTREVISGRHRFDLAKRTGEATIPAQIVKEADGFTLAQALTADAQLNIRDGHGKTRDFSNYFRNAELSAEEADAAGLRARAAGRAGWTIGSQGSPEVFDLHQAERLTDAQAEALARTAPGNSALQRAGIAAMQKGTPIDVTVNLLKAMELQTGPAPTPDQLDLFGADDSMMLRMEEQARRATEIQRGIRDQVAAVQGAAKRPEKAAKLGVDVKDPQGVQKKVKALQAELYRWESWPLHEDLRSQVIGSEAPATSPATTAPAPAATASAPVAPAPAASAVNPSNGGEMGSLGLQVEPSTRPRNPGETNAPQREDLLGELGAATRAGEANQAQGRLFNPTAGQPRAGEAGFFNAEILGELATAALQAGRDFVTWSREMIARFGEAVREMLAAVWQNATAQFQAREVRFGGRVATMAPAATRGFVTLPARPEGAQSGQEQTRSRFANPDEMANLYDVQGNETLRNEADGWMEANSLEAALQALESNTPPASLRVDHLPQLGARLIQKLAKLAETGNETQRLQADAMLSRAGAAWHGAASQEAGRTLQQRAVASQDLASIAPILAVKQLLVDRAERVLGKRFEGGGAGAVEKITRILQDAETDITERVERILAAVMNLKPVKSIAQAVQDLLGGKTQREQLIAEAAQALMLRARGNVVTPERKTALATLAQSLKRTLGAAVQGEAKKPAEMSTGEVLARAFVDQIAEAKTFAEAWQAGRQSVFDMFYDMELDKAYHPARVRREAASARFVQLDAGNEAQRQVSAAERRALAAEIEQLDGEMKQAKDRADAKVDQFWAEVEKLLPSAPTVAYAPGAAREAIKRGFAAAGYGGDVNNAAGTRTRDVKEALRDPKRAAEAVMRAWDAEAGKAGLSRESWIEGRKLAWQALQETLQTWKQDQADREAKALQAQRDKILAKDSPQLAKLLKDLAGKVSGLNWRDLFMALPSTQKDRQREIYQRLMLDQRLKDLTPDERLALTNELDKAWQRERRKVFTRELQRVGSLGEKSVKDRAKVEAATPRLLRLMNLGLLNSETFRGALAQEYGIKQIDAATGAELRRMGEAIQAAPEGLPRRKLEQRLIERLQLLSGATMAEILESWWTASVLSGWRTQMDIALSVANGLEDVTFGSLVTAMRAGKPRVAADAVWAMLSNLPTAVGEALNHVFTGNKSMMRNFDAEVKAALEDGQKLMGGIGRQLIAKGGLAKVPGAFMEFFSRLMTALDHVNSTSTYEGAKAMALARHPELYERALKITPADRAAARQQARLELTAGAPPATITEKQEENARVKEILDKLVPLEIQAEAREIGLEAALQGDPTGIGWWITTVSNKLGSTTKLAVDTFEKTAPDNTAGRAVLRALRVASTLVKVLTGTKFVRTVGHSINRSLSYVPGVGLVRFAESGMRGAKADVLLAKQFVGLATGLAALMFFRDGEDDEQGIEGGWQSLTPQQRSQLLAEGKQPYSVWWRDASGRVRTVNYQQWGVSGILATVGAMEDQRRYNSTGKDDLGILIDGIVAGSFAWTDKAQLTGLQMLIGKNQAGSGSPSATLAEALNKWASTTVGGLVPRIAKDIDVMVSPELRDTSEWWMKWAAQVPVLRELSSGKRVNIFGEDIILDRSPTSRVTQVGTADPAARLLGRLNERDIWLPDPTAGVRMVPLRDGTRRPMTTAEKDRYQRAAGAGYKRYILQHGASLLQMDAAQARLSISRATREIRAMAAYEAVKR